MSKLFDDMYYKINDYLLPIDIVNSSKIITNYNFAIVSKDDEFNFKDQFKKLKQCKYEGDFEITKIIQPSKTFKTFNFNVYIRDIKDYIRNIPEGYDNIINALNESINMTKVKFKFSDMQIDVSQYFGNILKYFINFKNINTIEYRNRFEHYDIRELLHVANDNPDIYILIAISKLKPSFKNNTNIRIEICKNTNNIYDIKHYKDVIFNSINFDKVYNPNYSIIHNLNYMPNVIQKSSKFFKMIDDEYDNLHWIYKKYLNMNEHIKSKILFETDTVEKLNELIRIIAIHKSLGILYQSNYAYNLIHDMIYLQMNGILKHISTIISCSDHEPCHIIQYYFPECEYEFKRYKQIDKSLDCYDPEEYGEFDEISLDEFIQKRKSEFKIKSILGL